MEKSGSGSDAIQMGLGRATGLVLADTCDEGGMPRRKPRTCCKCVRGHGTNERYGGPLDDRAWALWTSRERESALFRSRVRFYPGARLAAAEVPGKSL